MSNRKKEGRVKIFIILMIAILLIGGSAVGAYLEKVMEPEKKAGAALYLNSILLTGEEPQTAAEVFKQGVRSNAFMLAVMGVACASVFLFFISPAVLFYKGMAIGFTAELIMEKSTENPVLECCTSLLLQNMVYMLALGIYCYFTICMAMSIIRCGNKRYRGRIYADNLRILLPLSVASFMFLCIGAAAEAFINPVLSGII